MDLRKGHISLVLPINSGDSTIGPQSRKSLKRHWNQLSRFQKNLICIVLAGLCIFLFFLISYDDTASRQTKIEQPLEHIQIAPFKDRHENLGQLHLAEAAPDRGVRDRNFRSTGAEVEEVNLVRNNENHRPEDSKNIIDEPPKDVNQGLDQLNDEQVHLGNEVGATLQVIRSEPKEIVENEENVLEENRRSDGAKDFKGPTNMRQRAVVDAFLHSWKGYKEYAWGHDNLKPISMSYSDWFGLGLTIVDALDCLYIMDLQDEFDEARSWVDQYLRFDVNRDVNLFEVTIRVLGGLLSTYHLSGDRLFLNKALDLGQRLLPCFDSPSGIPYSDINIETMKAHPPKWSPDSSTSEVTTLQLEFRDLSRSTLNPVFENVAAKVNVKIHDLEKNEGLVPIFINANTGQFRNFATISLGARADSYYEYLIKQWLQTGKKNDDFLIDDYQTAIRGVINQLVRTTPNEKHLYIGELMNGKDFKPKMDHLTCYLPGTLLLGYKNGMPKTHLKLASDLLETCYQTYMKQPTQLAPEISYFNLNGDSEHDIYVKTNDAHNLLRPEFIESLYYFYAITGNKTYQDMGWTIFEAFNKYTKVKNGYTSIGNVKNPLNTRPRDMMESFWLGETLKYFYLLFSDDRSEIDLDKYVFNTEAHPLPIRED
ncbi:endoplasmic reticulum mannosyl-oligosaccharide 1,2-alpha-mannosidase [Topomyia yanbarensis]|uniref:endoplasmic reticulum mannosyl-oligosaccharide 1,2-alpha-mannosidase n=1 Tax=Topomyia yanbarensis TaxID=2498891 RepID=UPI00273B79FD|nr:endoplasmic reticulum mannosyl-oligosaccharide 1,2-alpha-mannosidase [Topomyia yanbarensis]